jgi:hypothetical protein
MAAEHQQTPERKHPPEGRSRRLLWFVLMYAASLSAFTAFVYGLRAIVPH